MKVPLLDLRPPLEDLRDEIVEAITQVIDSTRYIMGPEIDNLEKEIAEYCGTADAVGVSSGTDALLLSLMVLDVGPGDLVLTSNFSFFATAGVVARLNATPVFADIDPETYNIDPECVRMTLAEMDKETRKRVKAIIPVHLYGQCADMNAILNIAAPGGTQAFCIFCGSRPLNPDPLITPIEASETKRGSLQSTVTPEMVIEELIAAGFTK